MAIKLREIISIKKGKKHDAIKVQSQESLRLISIGDLRNNNNIIYTNDSKGTLVNNDDILIAWDGANAGTIGFGKQGIIGSTIARLRINDPKKFDTAFIGYYLKSKFSYLQRTANGATIPHISRTALDSIVIPDLKKNEQIRISKVLSSVEKLIVIRKKHIEQSNVFINCVFNKMFGNPILNDKNWVKYQSSIVIPKISSGTSYGGQDQSNLSKDELGVLKISAVTSGYFTPSEFKAVKKSLISKKLLFAKEGDLLFSRANTRELVAACAVVDKDYDDLFLPDKLWKLELNKDLVKTQFINHLLKNESFRNTVRKLASGGHTSMLNISMKKFQSLDLIVPDMEVQDKFCTIIEKVESLKEKYQSNLQKLENLYGSLSQKAFKGELDLAKLPLPDIEGDKLEDDSVIALQPIKAASGSLIEVEARQAIKYKQTPHVTADFSFDELPKTREEREALLSTLFNEQIDGKKGNLFDLEAFWQDSRVQHLLWNMPEEEQAEMEKLFGDYPPTELEIWQQQGKYKDYKKIREWIVMAIKGNRLIQEFDEDTGRIQLKVVG